MRVRVRVRVRVRDRVRVRVQARNRVRVRGRLAALLGVAPPLVNLDEARFGVEAPRSGLG